MIFNPTHLTTTAVALLSIVTTCIASDDPKTSRHNRNPQLTRGTPSSTLINCNNMSAWYTAHGEQERSPRSNSGLVYPRGTASAVYAAGLVWGGIFQDGFTPSLRVNGQVYNNGTKPGAILGIRTGIAEDPNSPDVRIWRIRRDYLYADLTEDASEIYGIPQSSVSSDMVDSVRNQYRRDWREWPWQKGAPFYDTGYLSTSGTIIGANNGVLDWGEDSNRNGYLDHGEDLNSNSRLDAETPGLLQADQVIWFVCNDIGVSQPWTCPESGIEEQGTIWAYNRNNALRDVVFKRFRLIYKGLASTPAAARIEGMYIGQWTDIDLGSYADDFAGCDTVLYMGYGYNGRPVDPVYAAYGLPPPAFGNALLQGPLIRTGNMADIGIFDFRRIVGARNLAMTSFWYHATGGNCADPPFNYRGAVEMYQMLRGLPACPLSPPDPPPRIDPVTGQPTLFWANGDPVTGTGWIDGILDSPGDRRFLLSSGPFTMAIGDTQEIIVANVGGSGMNNIQSITVMRSNTRMARSVYEDLFQRTPPVGTAKVSFPSATQAIVQFIVDGRPAHAFSIQGTLRRQNGSLVAQIAFYDDGAHGDGAPNNGIFGNSITVAQELQGLFLETTTTTMRGDSPIFWGRIIDKIPVIGPILIGAPTVFSDNLNSDGRANPGENIRFGLTITNGTDFSLGRLRITPSLEANRGTIVIPSFNAQMQYIMTYNPNDPSSFFTLNIPPNYAEAYFNIAISLADTNYNEWRDTVRIAVVPLRRPADTVSIAQVGGDPRGRFEIMLADPTAMKNHLYVVRSAGIIPGTLAQGITLKDSTDGRVLLSNHPIPDPLGHRVPFTDGFKLRLGNVDTSYGMVGSSWYSSASRWSASNASGFRLEGYDGAIGRAFGTWLSSSTATPDRLRSVVLRFAATNRSGVLNDPNDTTASFAYRYLRGADRPPARPEFGEFIVNARPGYAYQDFRRTIHFAAYDTTSTPPRRLAVGFLENNVAAGMVDGKYWPPATSSPRNTDTSGAHEFFFIFDLPYSQTAIPSLQADISTTMLPILWWGTPRMASSLSSFTGFEKFLIVGKKGLTAEHAWTFRPTIDQVLPPTYSLSQNYPNPFNPNTTIEYDLPSESHVRLKVFNILGQEVRTLVDEIQTAQYRTVQWDGTNNLGSRVASGVYFYRMEATSIASSGQTTVKVKKMALVR